MKNEDSICGTFSPKISFKVDGDNKMTPEEEVVKLAKYYKFEEVNIFKSTDCPQELTWGVDIGFCPYSVHFYDNTREGAIGKALEYLRTREGKNCMCDFLMY